MTVLCVVIKFSKSLAVRIHRCYKCGLVIDRDYNASLNIQQRGMSLLWLLPMEHREVTRLNIARQCVKDEEAIGLVR